MAKKKEAPPLIQVEYVEDGWSHFGRVVGFILGTAALVAICIGLWYNFVIVPQDTNEKVTKIYDTFRQLTVQHNDTVLGTTTASICTMDSHYIVTCR